VLYLSLCCDYFTACSSAGIDLVFVLDSSGSVRRSRWSLILEFTVDVVSSLTIGLDDSLVAAIVFSDTVEFEFGLQEHTSDTTLIPALRSLPFLDDTTCTADALKLLLSASQDGRIGLRDGRAHIVIVVTDGKSKDQDDTEAAAKALHAADIYEVFAAGLGDADEDELDVIASDPSLVFDSDSFDAETVSNLTDKIIEIICDIS